MANLILRDYLSEKETVLALANSILDAHIADTREQENNSQNQRFRGKFPCR